MARKREEKDWYSLKKQQRQSSNYHETRQIRTKQGIKNTSKRMDLNIIYDRVIKDIEQNNEIFYGDHNIYLHSHLNWFEKSVGIINQKLVDLFNKAKLEFAKDSESLKKIVLDRQNFFFKEMQDCGVKEINNKDSFKKWYESIIDLGQIDAYVSQLDSIKTGKKDKEELEKLLALIRDVYGSLEKTTSIDNNLPKDLSKKLKRMENALKNAKFTEVWKDGKKTVEATGVTGVGLSVTSLRNYYLPLLLERTIAVQTKNGIANLVLEDPNAKSGSVKLVSQQTAKGSSADLTIQSGYFSIKTRKAKQEKSRVLENFNNWNYSLSNPATVSIDGKEERVAIDALHTFLEHEDFYSMSEYVCYNYAYLGATDRELLDDCFRLLALSSLHEKMFGYNKKNQTGNLEELMKTFPIATLNAKGEVIFMDDMLESVTKKINDDISNITTMDNFFTYKLEAAFKTNPRFDKNVTILDSLWRKKSRVIDEIHREKKTTTYAELKSLVQEEINKKLKSMYHNIQVTISYNFQPDEGSEIK